jgi:Sensors of blue-light using FAD
MIRLVYVSTCADNVELSDIQSLLKVAERRNPHQGISGLLCWSGEFFLQCIEGDRAAVTQCFARILADTRHHSVELILSAPTKVRWFAQWGMGFSRMLSSHHVDLPAWTGGSFNPYLLEATELELAFERLSDQAQRIQGVPETALTGGLV